MIYDGFKLSAETVGNSMCLFFSIDCCIVVNIDIENTSLNLSSFTYASDTSNSYCRAAYQGNTQGIAYANNLLQIEVTSPNGTRALLKPVYANWDFDGKTMRKMLGLSNYRYDFRLNISECHNTE